MTKDEKILKLKIFLQQEQERLQEELASACEKAPPKQEIYSENDVIRLRRVSAILHRLIAVSDFIDCLNDL